MRDDCPIAAELALVSVRVAEAEFENETLARSLRQLRDVLNVAPPVPPRAPSPAVRDESPEPPPLPVREAPSRPRLEARSVQPIENATHVRVFDATAAAERALAALRAERAALTPRRATPSGTRPRQWALVLAWLPLDDLLSRASLVCAKWSATLAPRAPFWRDVMPGSAHDRALLWRHVLFARASIRACGDHRAAYAGLMASIERTRAEEEAVDARVRDAFRARDAALAKTVSKTLATLAERAALHRAASGQAEDGAAAMAAALPSMSALHRVLLATALSGPPRSGGSVRAVLERCLSAAGAAESVPSTSAGTGASSGGSAASGGTRRERSARTSARARGADELDWSMHGVDFVAALLLMRLGGRWAEADAWRCLSALLDDPIYAFRAAYSGVPGLERVYVRLAGVQYALALRAPRVEVHLRAVLGAPAHLWGLPFVLSAFADGVALPPAAVDRAWDALVTCGWSAVPSVAVALMARIAPSLLAAPTIADFVELWRDAAAMRLALRECGSEVEGGDLVAAARAQLRDAQRAERTASLPSLFAHACTVLAKQVREEKKTRR
jgi:hypothetical protein